MSNSKKQCLIDKLSGFRKNSKKLVKTFLDDGLFLYNDLVPKEVILVSCTILEYDADTENNQKAR
jgi:hypothetical protein